MKNRSVRIKEVYPQSSIFTKESEKIYIADFTERTNSSRGVEVHELLPNCPMSDEGMDCFCIDNPELMKVDFCIFDDRQFMGSEGNPLTHCECNFYPVDDSFKWCGFLEIKDCKLSNIRKYRDKVKEQILSSVNEFRKNGLIEDDIKVYGIVSFPRNSKTDFCDAIFNDPTIYKEWRDKYHIRLLGYNNIVIEGNRLVKGY